MAKVQQQTHPGPRPHRDVPDAIRSSRALKGLSNVRPTLCLGLRMWPSNGRILWNPTEPELGVGRLCHVWLCTCPSGEQLCACQSACHLPCQLPGMLVGKGSYVEGGPRCPQVTAFMGGQHSVYPGHVGIWGSPGCPALSSALLAPTEGTDPFCSDLLAFAQAIPTPGNAFSTSINPRPPLPAGPRRNSAPADTPTPTSVLPLTWDGLDSGLRN